jgi:hypothetical protein
VVLLRNLLVIIITYCQKVQLLTPIQRIVHNKLDSSSKSENTTPVANGKPSQPVYSGKEAATVVNTEAKAPLGALNGDGQAPLAERTGGVALNGAM